MDFTKLSKTISVNIQGEELKQFMELHAKGIKATAVFRRGLKMYAEVYANEGENTAQNS